MYFMKRIVVFATAMVAFLCTTLTGSTQAVSRGQKVKVSGLIVGRQGETFTVKTSNEGNAVVILTDGTKVEQPKGVFKLDKERMAFTALIPGLKVEVDGVGDEQSRVVAGKVKFSGKDLRTAEAVEAGLAPTEEEVKTNTADIQTNTADIKTNHESIAANEQQLAHQEGQIQSNQQQIQTNQQEIVAVNQRFFRSDRI